MKMTVKGSMTIVLSLLMILFLTFCMVLLEGVRNYFLKLEAEQAMELAEFSILSEYQRELYQDYGLFFVDLDYEQGAEHPTLGGFLEEIALFTDIERYDQDADAAVMMTMHSAKGLEFPNVFVVGMEEGLFPSLRCMGEYEEMEEERRLCYVALTRAKKRLYLTSARQRMLYGHTSSNMPSRFLREIPDKLIKKEESDAPSFGQGAYGSFGGGYGSYSNRGYSSYGESYSYSGKKPTTAPYTPPKPKTPIKLPAYKKGEMVVHDSFGQGMILSVLPVGSDAMLEVAFDKVGTKRLMATTAYQRMKKL